MATIDVAVNTVHLLVGGLWAGATIFLWWGLLPAAKAGDLDAGPFRAVISRFRTWSRAASLLLLLTGGHLAGTRYTATTLVGTTRGYLVVAMVVLWLVLTGLLEVGTGRLLDGLDERKVRQPARSTATLFAVASVVAVALLVVGGVLA
jgi:uncharacterized membrane protein